MIKTTTAHTITVNEDDLKKNLYGAFAELLTDSLSDDLEYFRMDLNRFHELVESVEKNGFRESFKDGYTMMLLNDNDFTFVDKWFNTPLCKEEELQVRIVNESGDLLEIIQHEDLSY